MKSGWRAPMVAISGGLAILLAACSSASSGTSTPSGSSSSASSSGSPVSSAAGTSVSATPVKVGWINIQGATVNLADVTDGANVAVDEVNKQLGGIAGHPIQLVTCFDDGTPAASIGCANKLVQSKVAAILVGLDANAPDIVKIAQSTGIPYVTYSGNSPQELATQGAYSLSGGIGLAVGALAPYVKQQGYSTVTAITAYSVEGIATVQQLGEPAYKKEGIDFKLLTVPVTFTDMSPQVESAVQAGAKALFSVGSSTFCTAFFKAVASVAPSTPRMAVSPCITSDVISSAPAAGLDGTMTPLMFRLDDTADKSVAAYDSAVKAYGTSSALASDANAAEGYGTVRGFADILNAGLHGAPVTPASVKAAMASAKNVPLPLAPGVTMSCGGGVIKQFPGVCSATFFIYKLGTGGQSSLYSQVNVAPLYAS